MVKLDVTRTVGDPPPAVAPKLTVHYTTLIEGVKLTCDVTSHYRMFTIETPDGSLSSCRLPYDVLDSRVALWLRAFVQHIDECERAANEASK